MGNKKMVASFLIGALITSLLYTSFNIISNFKSKAIAENRQTELKKEKLETMKEIAFEEKYIYTKDTTYTPGVKTHLDILKEKLNKLNSQIQ